MPLDDYTPGRDQNAGGDAQYSGNVGGLMVRRAATKHKRKISPKVLIDAYQVTRCWLLG